VLLFFSSGILHQDDGSTCILQQYTSSKLTTLYFKKDMSSFPDMVMTWSTNSLGIVLVSVKHGIDEIVFHNGSVHDVSIEPARGSLISSIIVHQGESKIMDWQLKYV